MWVSHSGFSLWRRYVIARYDSPGFATMHQVECIGLVHIQTMNLMVIDMMMIVMGGRKIEVDMVMAEKENGAIETMISIVVMEIVTAEIMRNVMAGMVIEMMTTGEEVEVLITIMTQEAEALTETMMKMANTHLGMSLSEIMHLLNYSFI